MPAKPSDIDPSFVFEGAPRAAAQAPWEFGASLAAARTDGAGGTTLATKIEARLARASARAAAAAAASSSSDEDDGSDDSEEEARLPGETDDDDDGSTSDGGGAPSSDAASASDDDDGDDDDDDEDDDDDVVTASEDEGGLAPPTPLTRRQREAAAVKAAAAADASSSDDDGDGAAAGATAARAARATAAAAAAGGGKLFDCAPEGTAFAAASFDALRLSRPLLKATAALGYARPTPIQAAVIPLALMGRDICGSAVTGSGKTAAFALPILERLLHRSRRVAATHALVLAPARELAAQVHSMIVKLAQFTDVRAGLVVGGLSVGAQAAALRARPEIVVATPGRMIDHLRNSHSVDLDDVAVLVLDEADRLLDAGFRDEVLQIVRAAPRARQTLLFSATMTAGVAELATLSLRRPVRLAADAAGAAPSTLTHEIVRLRGAAGEADREAVLLALAARSLARGRAIVFFATKAAAHRAAMLFGLARLPPAAELHGAMTQAARLAALESFRTGAASFLLATDVAARGLDILGVETVVNASAPTTVEAYLHRAGRTARAGAAGRVVTLVGDGDRLLVKKVARGAGAALVARVVPPAAVSAWRARVGALAPDVAALVRAEAEETALRKAEMEAAKIEHMVDHAAEIAARPPRTWFVTEKEKKATQAVAKAAADAAAARGEAGGGGGNAKARKNEAHKRKRADAAAERAAKRRTALTDGTAGVAAAARGAKARARALREEGVSPGKAGRIATRGGESSAAKKKLAKKKKAKKEGGGDGGEGGAAAPRPPRIAKVYSGGGRSGKVKAPAAAGRSKADAKRAARGGKGAKSFKSKAKHRRR